jgi:hypothetical protein
MADGPQPQRLFFFSGVRAGGRPPSPTPPTPFATPAMRDAQA